MTAQNISPLLLSQGWNNSTFFLQISHFLLCFNFIASNPLSSCFKFPGLKSLTRMMTLEHMYICAAVGKRGEGEREGELRSWWSSHGNFCQQISLCCQDRGRPERPVGSMIKYSMVWGSRVWRIVMILPREFSLPAGLGLAPSVNVNWAKWISSILVPQPPGRPHIQLHRRSKQSAFAR